VRLRPPGPCSALVAGLALAAACGPARVVGSPLPERVGCVVEAGPGAPLDTVTVALAGPVAADRPESAMSPAQRFLAAHQSGSVTGECDGRTLRLEVPAFRIVESGPLEVVLLPEVGHAVPVVVLRLLGHDADARELIARGHHLVITGDPTTLDYARRRGDLRVEPLPWSFVHVVAVPPASVLAVEFTPGLRAELARDAVRADARPAEPPYWWTGDPVCEEPTAPPARAYLPGIAVPRDDATARALADRLIALTVPGGPTRVFAFDGTQLGRVMAGNELAAYVLRLPRRSPSDCRGIHLPPAGWSIEPLVETRAHAVVRAGTPRFLVLDDGTVRLLVGSPR
jgi:hypothetical protein